MIRIRLHSILVPSFNTRQSRRPSRGMTLVEVMIAFAILIFGLTGVFALLNAGFRSHKRAVQETEARLLATSILAEMRADFFRGRVVPSDEDEFRDSTSYPNLKYNRRVVSLEPPKAGMAHSGPEREFLVRVEVRWTQQGENKSVAVETVMYCNRAR